MIFGLSRRQLLFSFFGGDPYSWLQQVTIDSNRDLLVWMTSRFAVGFLPFFCRTTGCKTLVRYVLTTISRIRCKGLCAGLDCAGLFLEFQNFTTIESSPEGFAAASMRPLPGAGPYTLDRAAYA